MTTTTTKTTTCPVAAMPDTAPCAVLIAHPAAGLLLGRKIGQ